MNVHTLALVLSLLLAAASAQSGRLPFGRLTPSGKIRPSTPDWYLTTAGNITSAEEFPVTSYRRFEYCSTDYPTGISFRCATETGPDFPTVVFRVSGKLYRKEFFAPYYLAENTRRGIIKPFVYGKFRQRGSALGPRVRLTCRVRTRAPVWVDVFDTCQ